MKKTFIHISIALLCFCFFAGNAMALPLEWGLITPTDVVATDAEMQTAMQTYWDTPDTGPAYFIWAEDVDLTTWTIAWTGGYGHTTDSFLGVINLQNSTTNAFTTLAWEGSDLVLDNNPGADASLTYWAHAWNAYDAITFTITDYTSPSYLGFDLTTNGSSADANFIFLGSNLETVASLGEDQDFAVLAPVPEPGTLLLLGSGLLGLLGLGYRRKRNNI